MTHKGRPPEVLGRMAADCNWLLSNRASRHPRSPPRVPATDAAGGPVSQCGAAATVPESSCADPWDKTNPSCLRVASARQTPQLREAHVHPTGHVASKTDGSYSKHAGRDVSFRRSSGRGLKTKFRSASHCCPMGCPQQPHPQLSPNPRLSTPPSHLLSMRRSKCLHSHDPSDWKAAFWSQLARAAAALCGLATHSASCPGHSATCSCLHWSQRGDRTPSPG